MGQLRELLFNKFSSIALDKLIKDYQQKYTPKKGRRFNIDGITYEMGEAQTKNGELEFEISSKIPESEIKKDYSLKEYFKEVKEIILTGDNKPVEIGMDEIIRKGSENEIKTRDYVRLKFSYPLSKLYDDQELVNLYNEIKEGKSAQKIPCYPGVNSTLGCLTLKMVEDKVYALCSKCVENLIKANESVRNKRAMKS